MFPSAGEALLSGCKTDSGVPKAAFVVVHRYIRENTHEKHHYSCCRCAVGCKHDIWRCGRPRIGPGNNRCIGVQKPPPATHTKKKAAESINREWVLNPANNTELAALGTIQGGSQTFDGLTIDATANGAKFAPRANDTQINAGTIISIPVPAHTNTATITLALSGGTTTITADAGEVSSDNTVIALPAAESARTVNVTFTAQTYLNGIALAEQQPEPEFPGTPTVAAKDANWDFTETGIDRPAVQGLPTTTKASPSTLGRKAPSSTRVLPRQAAAAILR